jgi:NAD(P)-dependent dehydrogenase (short-subunit alcohol dehydrogenase family)
MLETHPRVRQKILNNERPVMKIQGSVALVTGANRGIGHAIATALLSRGAAKVYAGVRNPTTINDPHVVPVTLDITDAASVSALLDTTPDVQIVVNNAGIGHPDTPLTAKLQDARSQMETNYLGLVSMTQTLSPLLAKNGGGAFVNMLVGAVLDRRPTPDHLFSIQGGRMGIHQRGPGPARRTRNASRRGLRQLCRHRLHGRDRRRQDHTRGRRRHQRSTPSRRDTRRRSRTTSAAT